MGQAVCECEPDEFVTVLWLYQQQRMPLKEEPFWMQYEIILSMFRDTDHIQAGETWHTCIRLLELMEITKTVLSLALGQMWPGNTLPLAYPAVVGEYLKDRFPQRADFSVRWHAGEKERKANNENQTGSDLLIWVLEQEGQRWHPQEQTPILVNTVIISWVSVFLFSFPPPAENTDYPMGFLFLFPPPKKKNKT